LNFNKKTDEHKKTKNPKNVQVIGEGGTEIPEVCVVGGIGRKRKFKHWVKSKEVIDGE